MTYNRGVSLTDKFLSTDANTKERFTTAPVDVFVQVEGGDNPGYLKDKILADSMEILVDALGNKKLHLKSTNTNYAGHGLYDDGLGRWTVDLPNLILPGGGLKIDESEFVQKLAVMLKSGGGLLSEPANGIFIDYATYPEVRAASILNKSISPAALRDVVFNYRHVFASVPGTLTIPAGTHSIANPSIIQVYVSSGNDLDLAGVDVKILQNKDIVITANVPGPGVVVVAGSPF